MKFSIKELFNKCDQIRRKTRILSYLLKKSLMENFIFCAVWSFVLKIFFDNDRKSNNLNIQQLNVSYHLQT